MKPMIFRPDSQPGSGAPGSPRQLIDGVPDHIVFLACENDGGRPLLCVPGGGGGADALVMETGMIIPIDAGSRRFSLGCRVGDEHTTLGLSATSLPSIIGLTAEDAIIYAPGARKKIAHRLMPFQFAIPADPPNLYARQDGTFQLDIKNNTDVGIFIARTSADALHGAALANGQEVYQLDPGEKIFGWRGPLFGWTPAVAPVLLSIVEHNIPVK